MTHVRFEFHSPLTLVRHWQQRADGARLREVLVTAYTLDLVFFERRFVSVARGLGARVTVLSDAHQAVHDPADVRHAGQSYQHSNISCHGAFHPKLAVLVGDDDVWISIGSGNPTTAGWGHNDELWLVLRTSRKRGPAALDDLANWLNALPNHVSMPSWIAAAVREIALMITPEERDDSMPDLRILGNLDQPIIHQLPVSSVDALRVAAPFFDPRSAAVRALVSQLNPALLIVGVQRTLGSYDGMSLVEAAAGVASTEFRDLPETGHRISHGKLVEWTVDDATIAMVGSPNLSYPALLSSTSQGGNCELAAIHPVAESLLPEGETVAPEVLRTRSTVPTDPQTRSLPLVTLLGARRDEQVVTLELLANTRADIVIETSPTGSPGTWSQRHVIRTTETSSNEPLTTQFPATEQSGAAVRALVDEPGGPFVTSSVFLTDTVKCLAREAASSAPRLRQQFGDVFTDEKLQVRFETDLLRLLAANAAYKGEPATPSPTRRSPVAADGDDRWTKWLEGVETTIGPSFTAALFPFTSTSTPVKPTSVQQWDVDLGGVYEDTTEDEAPEDLDPIAEEAESGGRTPPVVAPPQHRQMRNFAVNMSKAVRASPRPSLELRMLVAQLTFDLLAAGVWGPDDHSWRRVLADVITAVPPNGDEGCPEQALDFAGSLVAVGLALLDQGASLHGGRAEDIVLRRTWDAVGSFAAMAEPELSAQYLYEPAQSYTRVAGLAGVETVIALAKESAHDPRARIRAALEEEGYDVEFADGAWVVASTRSNPRLVAGKVATLIGEYDNVCAVLVRTERTGCCALLRDGLRLALAENRMWKFDELPSSVSTPNSRLVDGPLRTKPYSLAAPPAEIVELAERIGVNLQMVGAFLEES